MTEFEIICAALNREKIEFSIKEYDSEQQLSIHRGYAGFLSVLSFRLDGSLFDVGAYE